MQSEGPTSLVVEIEDLKRKADRFQDRLDQEGSTITSLLTMRERVMNLETSVTRLSYQIPRRSLGDDLEEVQTSIELQT